MADDNVSLEGVPGASISLDGVPGAVPGFVPATKKEIICGLPKFEELPREARTCLFQDNFVGGKVDIQKPHSQNFATTHSLMLTAPGEPSEYAFGANFFDSKLLMVGQLKNSRDTNGTMRYEFTKRLSAMWRMQIENGKEDERFQCKPFILGTEKFGGLGGGGMDFFRMDLDYKGEKFVSNLNMQRVRHVLIPDQQFGGPPRNLTEMEEGNFRDDTIKAFQCQTQHTHFITEKLCIGGSLTGTYQFQGPPTNLLPTSNPLPDWMSSVGFRYDPKDFVVTGSITRAPKRGQPGEEQDTFAKRLWFDSQFALKAEYAHKVVDKEAMGGNSIWLAAEFECDPDPAGFGDASSWAPQSSASLGYMISLASQGVRQSTVKGKITTEGMVTGTVEEQLNQAVSLVMNASLDHATSEYRFGFGMQVGGGM